MLTTTTKPYNPNKKQSLDTDWDKIDLCSFLSNINIINIDQNDISVTGKDYGNATTREIVAEIIRTINATHYNSLLGMKDIIKYNNNILKITESRNKSIAICNKKIKFFEAKINRIDFLLTKAAKLIPAVPLIDFKTMEKAKNLLECTSCHDLTFTKDDFKCNDSTNNINESLPELNIINANDIINTITTPTETNNKIESCKVDPAVIKDHNNKPTQQQLQPQLIQPYQISPAHISQNSSAISRDQKKPKNEPQSTSPTKLYPSQDITTTPSIKSKMVVNIDDIHLKTTQDIKQNKIQKKIKNKNKKYNKNNRKKRKYRKPKPKNQKHKKKQLLKDKPKEKILNLDELNQLIKLHAFSNDDYQFWMNQRVSQRPELTAFEYYEELYGKITDEKIKIWYNLYHAYL